MFSKAWTWIKQKISDFDAWVATWAPRAKTYTTLALGLVGDAAYSLQQYVTALPPQTVVSAEALAIFNLVVFSLAFWFHNMSNRNDS